ncbi:DNA alkylation response protein [Microlunatus panaciterrae]|uniref:Acyl-CoA dehydrogenase n=1 Tax=Microlunatus panaciterrae TaxID=400768 RepID=A0ABS2RKD6_9ACTN|nr:putative acyl-CoA dehydrogenase [Microlunatus panaciterrae]
MATHEVTNQVPPLVDYDAAATDRPLQEGLGRLGGAALAGGLAGLGRRVGDPEVQRWAAEANTWPPVLRTHDRYGHRLDEVDFHPAWHRLMEVAVAEGLHGAPWAATTEHPHLRRAAGFYLWSQAEAGHGCPISMTYAVVPALRHAPQLAAAYAPGLTSTVYDPGLRDPATKRGLLAGMGMTEKQGGSDVRANTTRAVASADGSYRLTGHKWFCSAPMCDVFLVLAQIEGAGLSCFCVPRVLPGGERNIFRLQRLKDKLGNRSNASAEVEFDGTVGWLVGEPGRGVSTILEMVTMTRLDCVIGSAAGQRAALVQAVHHARHRAAFGAVLVDQPLMRMVLTDLALEVEAASALMLRLAAAVDAGDQAFLRLALAAAKFWICKRSPTVVGEALECLGGNGYVEESGLPRLFRESPLNSIWEGSGNVICLDVLRALGREPDAVQSVLDELEAARGGDDHYDRALDRLKITIGSADPANGRRVAAALALALQGSLLIRFAPAPVADAFCASRLGGDWGHTLGTLPAGVDAAAILDRAVAG